MYAAGLQVKLQHGHAAEQIGAQQHARWTPGGEGGERQRDPAAPGHHALDPQRRVDGGDIGAGEAAQRAPGHHRRQADATHRVAERMRRLRRLAHRAQHQAGTRTVEKPHQRRDDHHRQIHQRMQAKQRRPDDGQLTEQRQRKLGCLGQLGLHIAYADEGREAHAEQRQRQAGRVLIGVEPDHQHAEKPCQHRTRRHARDEAERKAARVHDASEGGDRRAQHHALGAKIDDARFFVDQEAERGERERRTGGERRAQQQGIGLHQRAPLARPTQRTR